MRLRWSFLVTLVSIAILFFALPANAQTRSSDLGERVEASRRGVDRLERDVSRARRHIERAVAAPSRAGEVVMRCLQARTERDRRRCSGKSVHREVELAGREMARAAEAASRANERVRMHRIRPPRER